MKVESIDFVYLSMPQVLDIGDGSQDALLVRVRATGGNEGWGECEASPLVSIASLVCPMSHSACKAVQDSVLGQKIDDPGDIRRIGDLVRRNSFDLLQADHTLSGIDVALWDLLARKREEPVYKLLGYNKAHPKLPYASQLFGDAPEQTFAGAKKVAAAGYRAAKFGWGPFGLGSVEDDVEHLRAARDGLGDEGMLLVDAGTVWIDDVERAAARLDALKQFRALWLEEPFVSGALDSYRALARISGDLKLAGGEGCHNEYMARHMIDHAAVGYIQIDAGRIGGLTVAKRVADYAAAKGVTYVNHTFTSHLALSASIQPYAGLERDVICEYPVELKPLAVELTKVRIVPGADGMIRLPDGPGLAVTPDLDSVRKYLVNAEIIVNGRVLYRPPPV